MSSPSSSSSHVEQTALGMRFKLQFRDSSCPLTVQAAFERGVMVPFVPAMSGDKLEFQAQASLVGARYDFRLAYELAWNDWNQYSLDVEVNWANQSPEHSDFYRKSSVGWFELWTRELKATVSDPSEENNLVQYKLRCQEVILAEQQLSSVQDTQAMIVRAVQSGAKFQTSHKEGGTNIYWTGSHYVRSDFGDDPSSQQYATDAEFLAMLFSCFGWQVQCNSLKGQLSEVSIWRLILRQARHEAGRTA